MMRSLFSGVSGLQNHQTRMDVIGNNISNVNTIGFKKGRVNFQDMLSQTMSGAAKPTDERGGVNPKQVGLGMTVASIDTIHTQGSLQTTGVITDVAIQGNGFYILKDGNKEFFTRAGAFGLDEDGLLVNPANGLRVQGWMARQVEGETLISTAADPEDLIIPVGSKDPARATSEVDLACNLDKRTAVIPPGAGPAETQQGTWTLTKNVYDSFGEVHQMQVNFTRDPDTNNRWRVEVLVDPDGDVPTEPTLDVGAATPAGEQDNVFYVDFDNLGGLLAAGDDLNPDGTLAEPIVDGALQVPVSFTVIGSTGGAERQVFNLNLGEVGSYENTITQFAETSSTKAFRQNGYPMGYLETFKIDQSGVITGVYSNGSNRVIGQIAMASFTNPGGLEKAGESTYVVSNNSGDPNVSPSGVAGKGKVVAGALEMSNVDMAESFTDMIVTQRGFQANSRTITTSDQMLQELLTLKR